MNTPRYRQEVTKLLAGMDAENNQEQQTPTETPQPASGEQEGKTPHGTAIQDIYVYIVREREEEQEEPPETNVVETTLVKPKKPPVYIAYAICLFYLFLILSTLAFQAYEILNPPIATVTIIPTSQTVSLTGTLQLGRLLNPITISQSQTVPTTGKGHQDAKQAQGVITFYNGQFREQTIAAGTILTGSSGVQIATDQDAVIPAESQTIPPTLGQITVSAHALLPGVRGNILTGDINQGCCAPFVLAQNTTSFHGGLNERDYQTVSKADVSSVASPLKTAVMLSMQGALQGQVKESEQLFILPCSPTVTSDHQPGEEATHVKVTVSQTCSAVAYISQELERKAADLINRQASTKVGTGYSMFGVVRVTVTQTAVTHATTPLVFLSFQAKGTWIYALSNHEQQRVKSLIVGKSKQAALQLLASLPGIEQASIRWGDEAKLPKHTEDIRVVLMYGI